jgi:hypothetical protein
MVAAEVGQPGVNPHAGTGRDDENFCFPDDFGGFAEHPAPPEKSVRSRL